MTFRKREGKKKGHVGALRQHTVFLGLFHTERICEEAERRCGLIGSTSNDLDRKEMRLRTTNPCRAAEIRMTRKKEKRERDPVTLLWVRRGITPVVG